MNTSTLTEQALAQAIALGVAQALASLNLDSTVAPAKQAPAKKAAPAKAEPRYRTTKQIANGHEREQALYAAAYAAAGVKRFKDLTPAQQADVKAEVRAMWSALKGSRKTKA